MSDSSQPQPFRITTRHIDSAKSILVRPETPDGSDITAIRHLIVSDTHRTIPGGAVGAVSLVDHLHESDAYLPAFSLVATVDGKPVGYLLAVQVVVGSWTMLSLVGMAIGLDEDVLPLVARASTPGAGVTCLPPDTSEPITRANVMGHLLTSTVKTARAAIYSGLFIVGDTATYPSLDLQTAATFGITPPEGISPDALFVCETLPGSILETHAPLELDIDLIIALTKTPAVR